MTAIQGFVEPQFAAVKQAFSANFSQHSDVGGACSIYHQGKCVVDLWGGVADPVSGRLWQQDTLQLVFSTAKGLTATCIHLLVERGQLDLDAPIADYWPEFAANGKQQITTRMVMCHKAGLAAVDGDLTLQQVLNWEPVVTAIAAQAPNWPPGTEHGYHARSYGWILGEVLRRIEGISLGEFLQREFAVPLGLDLWIGLPAQQLSRCARVIPPARGASSIADWFGESSLMARVMNGPSNLFDYNEMWNEPAILQAEMPSSNAVATARSLAKFYAALIGEVDGIRLLQAQTVKAACEVQSEGPDKIVMAPVKFGSGYSLPPFLSPPCKDSCFGHPGAGGSMAFADPEGEFSFAYVMNDMRFNPAGDVRSSGLIEALYQCL
jgi:CubicO group peptidase (beta-lactamase class C family)